MGRYRASLSKACAREDLKKEGEKRALDDVDFISAKLVSLLAGYLGFDSGCGPCVCRNIQHSVALAHGQVPLA